MTTRNAATIRRELNAEYQQGAVNEMRVAKLRFEMRNTPHRHLFPYADGICRDCDFGTDRMWMSWDQIVADVRANEAATDAFMIRILTK